MSISLILLCPWAQQTPGAPVTDPGTTHNLLIPITRLPLLTVQFSPSHRRWPDG